MRRLTWEREGGWVGHQNALFEICQWRTLKPQGNAGPMRPAKGNSPDEEGYLMVVQVRGPGGGGSKATHTRLSRTAASV